jgi:glucose-1-phosphate cytidylyltransferase
MKVVILAGGLGTRLAEETGSRPKPMIDLGGRPLLWHVMKSYSLHGFDDFIICCGYKGYMIKEFFANYFMHTADVTFDLQSRSMQVHQCTAEPWRVTLVDTGSATMTGGRIRRIEPYLDSEEPFALTYGDGIADVDVSALYRFHRQAGTKATVTVVRPPGRFGNIKVEGDRALGYTEKPAGDGSWINGGFMILDPSVIGLVKNDSTVWEGEPMQRLAAAGDLAVFRHEGVWQPIDTLRDLQQATVLWEQGALPWKI